MGRASGLWSQVTDIASARRVLQAHEERLNALDVDGTALVPGSVDTAGLADGSVTTAKLADGAVTLPKLATGVLAASAEGLARMADGFLAATAAGRAKMAAGFLALTHFGAAMFTADVAGRAPFAAGFVDLGLLAATVTAALNGTPTIGVGTEAANTIRVTVQLRDLAGTNLAVVGGVTVWLSDTAGGAVTGTAPSGTVVAASGTIVAEHTAKVHLEAVTTGAGALVIDITEAGAATWHLSVSWGGRVTTSAAITFA